MAGVVGAANVRPRDAAFLASSKSEVVMMPDLVAHSLIAVEDEWQAKAAFYHECKTAGTQQARADCLIVPKDFERSCSKVLQAVVDGSSGDRDNVREYLDDVCGQNVLDSWHKETCLSFAEEVGGAMTQDNYDNRAALKIGERCYNYWSSFLAKEEQRLEVEEKARAEKEKAEAEVQAKAAAEAKAKADAEAKVKAEAEAKAKTEAAVKARAEAEAKAKADAEAKAKAQAEAKAKYEVEAKLKAEKAEAKAKAQEEAEAKAKAEKEAAAKVKTTAKTQATQASSKVKDEEKVKEKKVEKKA